MAFDYIRRNYGVPADLGRTVIVDGRPGMIVEDRGNYLGVSFDDDPDHIINCHPTWNIEYGDQIHPGRMKAYHVWCIDGWSGLVLASSAAKAKAMFWRDWRSELDNDWRRGWDQLRCRRAPEFDGLSYTPRHFDGSGGEPAAFWSKWDEYGQRINDAA